MSLIDDIIALEWQAFDKVQNAGGRAACQEDFETFAIMRRSQFLSWDEATRHCYHADLVAAQACGRNLVQEKYARMMASTAPEEYGRFAHLLPPLTAWQHSTIESIVAVQIAWREAFAAAWPGLSGQARCIRTCEDTAHQTSFETYLRGELGTFSEATLRAYQTMVEDLSARGENLTTLAMSHTAQLYGYASLAAAEAKLQKG